MMHISGPNNLTLTVLSVAGLEHSFEFVIAERGPLFGPGIVPGAHPLILNEPRWISRDPFVAESEFEKRFHDAHIFRRRDRAYVPRLAELAHIDWPPLVDQHVPFCAGISPQLVHHDRVLLVGICSGGFKIFGEERRDGTFDGDAISLRGFSGGLRYRCGWWVGFYTQPDATAFASGQVLRSVFFRLK